LNDKKQEAEKNAELLVLRSAAISASSIPISGERKENKVTDEMNLTATLRFPVPIDR